MEGDLRMMVDDQVTMEDDLVIKNPSTDVYGPGVVSGHCSTK